MLILSRKVGEKIVIGDQITVVVSRVAGERVTLGLEAPGDVRILRGELRPFADKLAPTEKVTARGGQKRNTHNGFNAWPTKRPR